MIKYQRKFFNIAAYLFISFYSFLLQKVLCPGFSCVFFPCLPLLNFTCPKIFLLYIHCLLENSHLPPALCCPFNSCASRLQLSFCCTALVRNFNCLKHISVTVQNSVGFHFTHVRGISHSAGPFQPRVFILLPCSVQSCLFRTSPPVCCSAIASLCQGSTLLLPGPLLLTHDDSFSKLQKENCCWYLSLFANAMGVILLSKGN